MGIVLKVGEEVFVEMTNTTHGGAGWEIGKCLWSPEKGSDGRDCWRIMRDLQKGDLVIHSVKTSKGQMMIGVSRVKNIYTITTLEPPHAGRLANRGTYYRADLEDYSIFEKGILMQDFLDAYGYILRQYKNSFYTKDLKPAEKYVTHVDPVIADILIKYLGI